MGRICARGIISGVQENLAAFTFEHDHILLSRSRILFYPYEAPGYAPLVEYQEERLLWAETSIRTRTTKPLQQGLLQILDSLERLKRIFR